MITTKRKAHPPHGRGRRSVQRPPGARRGFRLTAITLLMVLGAGCARQSSPPDVVWIVVDTLRADHVGCYGFPRPTTPNIDRLAGQGVRFETAYSQAPWTTPSFASMLTSLYPTTLGVTEKPDRLDDRFTLLPEVLSAHGWGTGAVISHYFLKAKWNLCQGFDVYDESAIVGHGGVSGDITTGAALDFLDNHPDRPVFLLVHYFDPHYDYIEHPGYLDTRGIAYDGPVTSGMVYTDLKEIVRDLDDEDLDYLRRLYDSEIAYTDARIGELLDGLRARGRFDDAVIVVTADHGEELLDHGGLGHGTTVELELLRIPLIFGGGFAERWAGRVVEEPVRNLDLGPTLVELAGLEIPSEFQGRSLVPAIENAEAPAEPVPPSYAWIAKLRSLTDAEWHCMRNLAVGRVTLYHRPSDPAGLTDVAGSNPDVVAHCIDELDRLERSKTAAEEKAKALKAVEAGGEPAPEDRETIEQLEALGYVEE